MIFSFKDIEHIIHPERSFDLPEKIRNKIKIFLSNAYPDCGLKFIKESKYSPKEGDVFVLSPKDDVYINSNG